VADVSVADGRVRELYSDLHEIGRVVWLARGDALVAAVLDQTGRGQLWAISYPQGKTVRLTNDLEHYQDGIDVTRDGKNVVAITTRLVSNVWVLPDADASRARQITSTPASVIRVASMSLGHVLGGSEDGGIWLIKTDGSEPSPLTASRNTYSPTPCGGSIVFNSLHDGTIYLVRVDADGLKPTTLFHGDIGPPTCSNDGHQIFFTSTVKSYAILRVSSQGGETAEIVRSPGYQIMPHLAISPNGKLLAYAYDDALPSIGSTLAIIPASGGATLRIFKVPSDIHRLRWSHDGQRLQFLLTRSGATNIWEQSIGGGEPKQFTKFTSGRIFDFDWSTDGKELVLTRGDTSSDVVLFSRLR
jgi:Tol biopolymer transport system component